MLIQLPFPNALIFDWDNTLVDSWSAIADAMNTTLVHFGQPTWDLTTVKSHCVRSARPSFPEWFGDQWQEASEVFYARFSVVQMQALTPAVGADNLLKWLHSLEIPLCVVSNKNGQFLRKEAHALQWNGYFRSIVGATDALRDKPAREHADHALTLAALTAGPDVWFVGDSDADIACARNSGCTPVLLGTAEAAEKLKVELFFSDCDALLALLRQRRRAIA